MASNNEVEMQQAVGLAANQESQPNDAAVEFVELDENLANETTV